MDLHVDDPFIFDDPADAIHDGRRLEALRNTGLLNARHRPALDAITRLAAATTAAPSARVSLVDADRQVFPSRHEAGATQDHEGETPLSHSFCRFVVVNDAPLVLEDAREHPALLHHPAVVEDGVVAYAGYPLHGPSGEVLGALCVLDTVPRQWTEQHLAGLRDLAVTVETKIALRLSRRETHLDHARLMHVLDGAANTAVVIADADGVVDTINRAGTLLLGHDAAAVVGSWTLSDLATFGRASGPEAGPGEAQDWTVVLADGQQQVISVRTSTLYDVNGDVDGYVLVGDDVSAHRHAAQVLRDTVDRQAEVVRRLEALDTARDDFIATASHELRTPVTSILGFTELLAEGVVGRLTEAQSDLVGRVDRNSRRLLHLVEDLLNLTRLDAADVDPVRAEVDVATLAGRAWESIQPELGTRDLKATVEITPVDVVILGDPVQLERALLNLLTNAVKFTPDGGSVSLVVAPHEAGVLLEVADSGRGIDAAELESVFEPFFRTQDAQVKAIPGSGVGLTVVRRIVEGHGGQILLSSEVGCGTTARIVLPV